MGMAVETLAEMEVTRATAMEVTTATEVDTTKDDDQHQTLS